ncbi:DUF444 family protein [Desulfopila inferna]|uniref:DUF444 family protein n=1 Tax=Desulfopila inferna TaxID=468528 RepID=UPI001962511B|nr:DUF444 family protein [Desulfopila inferna]MBM9606381.1 DUF444 family protein [Desulfopila inferna]
MKEKMEMLNRRLNDKKLTPKQKRIIELELRLIRENQERLKCAAPFIKRIWEYNDLDTLQDNVVMRMPMTFSQSIDDLIARDTQREKDGFPRKIRIGKMIKPSQDGAEKVVVVPTTVEEKLLHDQIRENEEESENEGGSGEGEEGEVIGEQPVREEQEGGEGGAGQGEGGSHETDTNAYDMGRILTEQFQLPNLKEKGKKRSLSRYVYDLTDKNRGFGQIIDKKATLKKIIETNIGLGRIKTGQIIEPRDLLISPADRIYRILSREKDYESQAVVFFLRDYSGSMHGNPTEMVVTQHVLIYSWLIYQYENHVETRFILHDTEAKEVKDFHTYYNLRVAGGTQVASAYRLVNEIVAQESLERDYNIYIFHGTDGDDWDTTGRETLPELEKMLTYANRIGITVAENGYGISGGTEVEKYLKKSGLLEEKKELLRLDVMKKESDEPRLIEGIKKLIS